MRVLFAGKRVERSAAQAVHGPFRVRFCTEALIEPYRVFVPVEHGPLEAAASPLDGDLREARQQRTADAATAVLRIHEEVLQVDPGLGEKGREVVKEQREANWRAFVFGDQGLREAALAEEGVGELLLGHHDLVLELLVTRKGANQARDRRDIFELA